MDTVVVAALRRVHVAVLAAAVLLTPGLAMAQALGTVAGTVKDASGAVLPGVTVEVASPALIEKVRTGTTDGSGQYRIINLPPGDYTVTFTLPGFATVKRTDVEVSANFTATIDGDLRVGGLEETITVTGESPIVDVQWATLRRTATFQVFKEIPSSGSWTSMAAVMSAVRTSSTDVGGVLGDPTGAMISAHGSREQDMVSLFDGMRIGNMYQSSNNTNMSLSPLLFEQVDIQMSGQTGETGTNGVILNAIPRSGGNRFSGTALINGSAPGSAGQQPHRPADGARRRRHQHAEDALRHQRRSRRSDQAGQGVVLRHVALQQQRVQHRRQLLPGRCGGGSPRQDDTSKQAFGGTYLYDNNGRVTWAINDKQKFQGWYAFQVQGRSALADRVAHPVHLARSGPHHHVAHAAVDVQVDLHGHEPDAVRGRRRARPES